MYTQKKKKYYAIVKKTTGRLLLMAGHLPIYWSRQVAYDHAKQWEGTEVVPIDGEEMQRLLTTNNKKMDEWLEKNKATSVNDFVWNRKGIISEISKGHHGSFHVIITPSRMDIDLGSGCGNKLKIIF